jgi:hypothetical protein
VTKGSSDNGVVEQIMQNIEYAMKTFQCGLTCTRVLAVVMTLIELVRLRSWPVGGLRSKGCLSKYILEAA